MDISSAEHLLSSNLEEEASEVPAGADVPQEAVPAAPAAGNGTQDSPDGGDRDAVTEEAAAAQGAAEDRSAKLLPSFSGWGFPSSFSWGKVMESGGKMMQTVKKQTEGVIDVYRKDITELVNVVTTETTQVAEKLKPVMVSTTGTVVENLKNIVFEDSDEEDEEPTEFEKAIEEQVGRLANSAGKVAHNVSERLSSLLNQAVKIRGADDDKKKSKKLIYDPKQVLVAALRADPATFLEDPHESTASPNELLHDDKADTSSPLQRAETRFQAFRTDFNIAEHAGQISRILNEDAEMKRMLERIVPAQASYEQFWQRYFFKIAEIDVLEARRKALMQGVQTADDEEFTWDEDDSSEEAAANSPSDAQPDAEAKDAAPKDAEPKEPEVSEGIVSSVSESVHVVTDEEGDKEAFSEGFKPSSADEGVAPADATGAGEDSGTTEPNGTDQISPDETSDQSLAVGDPIVSENAVKPAAAADDWGEEPLDAPGSAEPALAAPAPPSRAVEEPVKKGDDEEENDWGWDT